MKYSERMEDKNRKGVKLLASWRIYLAISWLERLTKSFLQVSQEIAIVIENEIQSILLISHNFDSEQPLIRLEAATRHSTNNSNLNS